MIKTSISYSGKAVGRFRSKQDYCRIIYMAKAGRGRGVVTLERHFCGLQKNEANACSSHWNYLKGYEKAGACTEASQELTSNFPVTG